MKLLLTVALTFFTFTYGKAQLLDTVRALTEINVAVQADAFPYITNDGLRLYYTNNSTGTNDLYFTSRTSMVSSFAPPQLVDPAMFSGINSSWFTEDELEIYYSTGSAIYHASRATTATPFGAATQLTLTGNSGGVMNSPSLTQNGDELYIYEPGVGTVKYTYTSPFTYSMQSVLTPPAGLNGAGGQLSVDGLTFYWTLTPIASNDYEIYVMSRANLGDSFGVPTIMNNLINDGTLFNGQASYSTAKNVLVWVRGSDNLWNENELYIGYNKAEAVAGLDDLSEDKFDLDAYPNPFSGALTINFTLNNAETVHFLLTDELGRTVMQFSRNALISINNEYIDLSGLAMGTYYLTLFTNRFTETKMLLKR